MGIDWILVIVVVVSVLVGLVLVLLAWHALMLVIAKIQRGTTERILIGHLASVVRQNLPLAMALSLAAESERGSARTALRRLSRVLAQGALLSEALPLAFRDCSPLMVSLIAAGEKAGQLPAALEQAEAYLINRSRQRKCFDTPVLVYVVLVMGFSGLLVSGMMVAVVPKFKVIFQDFGTKLPGITMSLINASEWLVTGTPPGWLIFPLALFVIAALVLIRLRGLSIAAHVGQWFRWYMPGLRRMEFGGGVAEMLRLMRSAVRGGMNLPDASDLAAGLEVNRRLQDKMRRFAGMLQVGIGSAEASREAGLGPVLTTAFATGLRSGDMDAALRYAADYHAAIVARWWVVISTLAWPACTLVLASIVTWVVVALFLPLVQLINSVAGGG